MPSIRAHHQMDGTQSYMYRKSSQGEEGYDMMNIVVLYCQVRPANNHCTQKVRPQITVYAEIGLDSYKKNGMRFRDTAPSRRHRVDTPRHGK